METIDLCFQNVGTCYSSRSEDAAVNKLKSCFQGVSVQVSVDRYQRQMCNMSEGGTCYEDK